MAFFVGIRLIWNQNKLKHLVIDSWDILDFLHLLGENHLHDPNFINVRETETWRLIINDKYFLFFDRLLDSVSLQD